MERAKKPLKIRPLSPLGDLSSLYLIKSSQKGSIQDYPEEGMLELYPACFTQVGVGGASRQECYKNIWNAACNLGTEQENYPFSEYPHHVVLWREETNEHDPNAVRVSLLAEAGSPLHFLNGADLGYIPKKISKQIKNNISMITSGKILKVRMKVYGKFYAAKVMFSYAEERFSTTQTESEDRFSAIILER